MAETEIEVQLKTIFARQEQEIRQDLEKRIRQELRIEIAEETRMNLIQAADRLAGKKIDSSTLRQICGWLQTMDAAASSREFDTIRIQIAKDMDRTIFQIAGKLFPVVTEWRKQAGEVYKYVS